MKKGLLVLSASMLALSLAACSSGGEKPAESAKPGDASKSPDASKAPKQMTLKIGLPGSYDVTKKEIIDGFIAKNPNIKVELVEAPWGDFVKKIQTEIAGGTAPDIWFQENAVILGYGKRGVAEDLSVYIKKDLKQDEYISGLFAAQASDGKVYGVPHGINPIALAYNKKMFTDAGVPLPTKDWTYQDMLDAAKKLSKDTNGDGKLDQYGFGASSSITVGWYPWTRSKGGQVLDETKSKAMFTDPKSLDGIKTWANLVKDGISPDADFYTAAGGDWKAFASGKVAMFFMQYSNSALINKDFPNLDYDTIEIPKGYDGKRLVPMVTNSWLIFSKAKADAKEAAWEFMKYYLSEEAQTVLAKSGAALPVNKKAMTQLDTNASPKNKKAYSDGIAEAGVTLDENPSWNEWRLAAQPIYSDIYAGKLTPEEGVKQLQEKVQKVLDDNK